MVRLARLLFRGGPIAGVVQEWGAVARSTPGWVRTGLWRSDCGWGPRPRAWQLVSHSHNCLTQGKPKLASRMSHASRACLSVTAACTDALSRAWLLRQWPSACPRQSRAWRVERWTSCQTSFSVAASYLASRRPSLASVGSVKSGGCVCCRLIVVKASHVLGDPRERIHEHSFAEIEVH